MLLTKKQQVIQDKCFSSAGEGDCDLCECSMEVEAWDVCGLLTMTKFERIWLCHNCNMLGNVDEFHLKDDRYYCKSCNQLAEEAARE
jgi:hypothetical protein